MLIQRAGTGTLPPTGFVVPPWSLLKLQWDATPAPSTESVILGPAMLTLGHDDSEADDFLPNLEHEAEGREYGWDNESPARQVEVGKFRAAWRPVTNKEFLSFWRAGKAELPKSWVEEDGEIKARYSRFPELACFDTRFRSERFMDRFRSKSPQSGRCLLRTTIWRRMPSRKGAVCRPSLNSGSS
jgi:formylglycine-generating enzyme required for sulfatase activity